MGLNALTNATLVAHMSFPQALKTAGVMVLIMNFLAANNGRA